MRKLRLLRHWVSQRSSRRARSPRRPNTHKGFYGSVGGGYGGAEPDVGYGGGDKGERIGARGDVVAGIGSA